MEPRLRLEPYAEPTKTFKGRRIVSSITDRARLNQ